MGGGLPDMGGPFVIAPNIDRRITPIATLRY